MKVDDDNKMGATARGDKKEGGVTAHGDEKEAAGHGSGGGSG
uniref:Uncharacterized protein n=1 Tax=Oryza sativa subsp. japonica TaxID=39947 RepID=Q6AT08_ORYSJ|nr:hypothetical protein [Oryza sativa Japonica Group]